MENFEYRRPESLPEACTLLDESDDAVILSGGQSLVPMIRQRATTHEGVIDINALPDQEYIDRDGDRIRIGCLARHADIAESPLVRENCEILAETAEEIGDLQVRQRGTLCGSIAHADPAGDPPVIAVALDAEIVATSSDGERTYEASGFFEGFYETALADNEIVSEVRFPTVEPPYGGAYEKYEASAGAYPTATAAAVVRCDDGVIEEASLVTGAVSDAPERIEEAESSLEGREPTEGALADAARVVGETVDPIGDAEGSERFKRGISQTLSKRALETAVERAGGEVR